MFGAASAGSALDVAFAAVDLTGVALAAAGVIGAATAAARRRLGLVDAVLLTGLALNLAAYLARRAGDQHHLHQGTAPVLPFAAALAGRQLGGRLAAARLAAGGKAAGGDPGVAALRYGLCAVLAGYAAMLGYDAAQPPAPPQYAGLAAWLSAQHLTDGLSSYHQANIATLESGGAVTLRAVRPIAGRRIGAYTWLRRRPRSTRPATANFLVLTAPGVPAATGDEGLTVAEARALPPSRGGSGGTAIRGAGVAAIRDLLGRLR